ncbi:MAG: glycosyltransferase family 2 protein [Candidatus Melainabacteria bacterium]
MKNRSQTVSVVVIAHDHVQVLDRALSSVTWADEVIVLDRGSTDGTLEIAQRFTRKIHFHPSPHKQRLMMYGCELATSEWILYLEPHEWVEEMLKHEIDGILLNTPEAVTGYRIPMHLIFQNDHVRHGGSLPTHAVRLFRKNGVQILGDADDHSIRATGQVRTLDHAIATEPFRDIHEIFEAANFRASLGALRRLEAGQCAKGLKGVIGLLWAIKWTFIRQYFLGMGFMDGIRGLTFALAGAYEEFLIHAKFRALTT